MRKQPLILPPVSLGGKVINKIEGLDKLGPFGSSIWNEFKIYTTPSLFKTKTNYPKYYIFSWGGNLTIRNRETDSDMCLGDFYNLMSDEEKAEFDNDIDKILEVLD